MRILNTCFRAIACALILQVSSLAQTPPPPSVTVSTNATTNGTTFSVTVSGLAGNKKFRDLHFSAAKGKHFPRITAGTVTVTDASNSTSDQSWHIQDNGTSHTDVHVYTGTSSGSAAGFGNGTYELTVPWNADDFAKAKGNPVTWSATDDGAKSINVGHAIDTNEGKQAPNVPQFTCMLADDENRKSAIGSTTSLPITSGAEFQGTNFTIYAATLLNADYTDPLGIGIETNSAPIPSNWQLSFANFSGTINTLGTSDYDPTVQIPNDSQLEGKSFYLVLAFKDAGGTITTCSNPIQILITNE